MSPLLKSTRQEGSGLVRSLILIAVFLGMVIYHIPY